MTETRVLGRMHYGDKVNRRVGYCNICPGIAKWTQEVVMWETWVDYDADFDVEYLTQIWTYEFCDDHRTQMNWIDDEAWVRRGEPKGILISLPVAIDTPIPKA